MKTLCAWCQKEIASDNSNDPQDQAITHGICDACVVFFKSNDRQPLREFINSLDVPILLVDREGLVEMASHSAQQCLCKETPEIDGLLTGEVIECSHARLPGGCGRTEHCAACTLRRTITQTFKTGQSARAVTAIKSVRNGSHPHKMRFRISTEKVGDHVLLRLDEVRTLE